MITVVHAADLHIDSPLRGLGRLEGAPVDDLRLATRRAFVRLVDTCLEEQAALLILAGDVFDGEWRDFNTGLFFVRELARLRDVGTQVVMVRGNHDAESVITRHIPLPDHVFTFSVDAPESRDYPRLGLAVHGQSYGARSVEDNLAEAYPRPPPRPLQPRRPPHQRRREQRARQLRPLHRRPASPPRLRLLGARPRSSRPDPAPRPLGRLPRQPTRPARPRDRRQGLHPPAPRWPALDRVESREVDVLRWAELVVSADAAHNLDDLLSEIRLRMQAALADAAGRPVLARVTVEGTTALHTALAADPAAIQGQIRALAAELGDLWPEKIRFVTRPPLAEPGELHDLFQTLRDELRQLAEDPATLARYSEGLAPLVTAAAPLLGHRPDEPARLIARLGELESLLLARLGATQPVPKASSLQPHAPNVAWSEGAVSHEV